MENCIKIYTDGSIDYKNKTVGSGVSIYNWHNRLIARTAFSTEVGFSIGSIVGEVNAVKMALGLLSTLPNSVLSVVDYNIEICHDFDHLNPMNTVKIDNPVMLEYYSYLENFILTNPQYNISFKKVKGHSNDQKNKLADKLANYHIYLPK